MPDGKSLFMTSAITVAAGVDTSKHSLIETMQIYPLLVQTPGDGTCSRSMSVEHPLLFDMQTTAKLDGRRYTSPFDSPA